MSFGFGSCLSRYAGGGLGSEITIIVRGPFQSQLQKDYLE